MIAPTKCEICNTPSEEVEVRRYFDTPTAKNDCGVFELCEFCAEDYYYENLNLFPFKVDFARLHYRRVSDQFNVSWIDAADE